jgi:4-diphosphocytidyl-2-C-methyl-D-erythritol kinase
MVKLKAYGKLNLSLFVGNINDSLYHEIKSVVVPITLYDTIIIKKSNVDKLIVRYDNKLKNQNIENNIVSKALLLFREYYHIYIPVKIILYKRIPLSSGLGGESTDASTTLLGLIKHFNIGYNEKILQEIALKLGSDTLFCLFKKSALIQGRGEQVSFIEDKIISSIIPTTKLTLFINDNLVETKKAFSLVDNYPHTSFDTNPYLFTNDFLPVFLENKDNKILYNRLTKEYLACYLSGSGNCLYVFSHKKIKINNCFVKKCYVKL